ncbi:phage tail tape measure protein [Bacteroides acidifaciens]|uniref:phage tail tape measure protein n=1 Tax=Bacteroides acidifaciens TaxID=85831 RepID=UPI002149AA4A|nr:phage tail tape measure protein [Bacteroides acidifaciens]MCR2007888.1 phage tail tape measure protein [Bacteroides acidifaciens]
MSDNKDVKRGIVLYLDGKEVVNNVTAIEAECRKLVKEQKAMTMGSKEYIEQGKKIRTLKGILAEHNRQLRAIEQTQTFSLSKGVDWFNKYAASIMAVVGALTGVVLKLNSFRNLLNEREEAKANVKALTGLDDDSIEWMEQKAVELSTTMDESGLRIRQSASEIMEAYMMVGSNKPELLESKEALNAVTVETMRLAAASGMSLTRSVDATTTALNQYGAGADEAAKYVNVLAAGSKHGAANVEQQAAAILKAGTIAATSNIPIEELVGTIEMLGEKGIKSEIAGTGLKTFFTRLATGAADTNPKVVGLSTALDNLNKKVEAAEKQKVGGGTTLLKKLFGDEGMQTAMILSQNTEKVKEYTRAVTDTSIAYEQAAINSDTAAAKLDQVKNELNEQGIVLMKELNPAITRTLSHLVNWSKYTVTLVRFIAEHRATLGMLTTAIILYTVWVNKKIILDKLQVLWNEKVLVSIKSVNAALKANPWLAVASAVLVVIGALVDYQRNQNKITQSMRSLESINKKTSDEYDGQAAKIERLTQMINNNNLSLAIRREKLEELKSIVPDYNAQLTDEGTIISDNTEAIKKYLVELEKQIKLKAAQEELEELYKKQRLAGKRLVKEKEEEKNAATSLAGARFAASQQSSSLSTSGTKVLNTGLNQSVKQMETLHNVAVKAVRATEDELQGLADAIEDVNKEIASTSTSIVAPSSETGNGGGNGTGGETETEKQKRIKKELAAIETTYLKKQNDLKKQYMQDEKMSQQDYANELEKLELEKLNEKLAVAGLEPEKREEINQKIMDAKVKLYEKIQTLGRTNAINDENALASELERIQVDYDKKHSLLEYALEKEVLTLKEYNKQKKKLEQEASEERNKANEKAAQKRLKKEEQIYGKEVLELRHARIKENLTDEQYNNRLRKSRLKWLERMLNDLKLSEEDRLELQQEYNDLVIEGKEEEYEKIKEAAERYAELTKDIATEFGETIGEMIAEGEFSMKEFLKETILMALDALERVIEICCIEVMAKNMAATAPFSFIGAAKAAIQIAAIKAAFAVVKGVVGNFYTGGYTGGGDWDEPKGIVHSDEFVANRFAVANPAVRPVLDLIDHAQRTGSIDNLSSDDLAAVTGKSDSSSVTVVSSPVAVPNGGNDNEVKFLLIECSRLMKQMEERLKEPLLARTYANGKGGTMEAEELVNKMKRNAQRRK